MGYEKSHGYSQLAWKLDSPLSLLLHFGHMGNHCFTCKVFLFIYLIWNTYFILVCRRSQGNTFLEAMVRQLHLQLYHMIAKLVPNCGECPKSCFVMFCLSTRFYDEHLDKTNLLQYMWVFTCLYTLKYDSSFSAEVIIKRAIVL